MSTHEVFVSHSTKDAEIAKAVCHTLESEKIRCWVAPRDIQPGETWASAIVRAITGSRVMLLIYSEHSNLSKQVLREVERAVAKDVPILPFRISDTPMSEDMEYFLSTPHWLDAIDGKMEDHLATMKDNVKRLVGNHQASAAPGSAADSPPPPAKKAEKTQPQPRQVKNRGSNLSQGAAKTRPQPPGPKPPSNPPGRTAAAGDQRYPPGHPASVVLKGNAAAKPAPVKRSQPTNTTARSSATTAKPASPAAPPAAPPQTPPAPARQSPALASAVTLPQRAPQAQPTQASHVQPRNSRPVLASFAAILAGLLIWHGSYWFLCTRMNEVLVTSISRSALAVGFPLAALSAAVFVRAGGVGKWLSRWAWVALLYSLVAGFVFGAISLEGSHQRKPVAVNYESDVTDKEQEQRREEERREDASRQQFYFSANTSFLLMLTTGIFSISTLIGGRRAVNRATYAAWDRAAAAAKAQPKWPIVLGVLSLAYGIVAILQAILWYLNFYEFVGGWMWFLIVCWWCLLGLWITVSAVLVMVRQREAVLSLKAWSVVSIVQGVLLTSFLTFSTPGAEPEAIALAMAEENGASTMVVLLAQESEKASTADIDRYLLLSIHVAWAIALPLTWLWWLHRPSVKQQVARWPALLPAQGKSDDNNP